MVKLIPKWSEVISVHQSGNTVMNCMLNGTAKFSCSSGLRKCWLQQNMKAKSSKDSSPDLNRLRTANICDVDLKLERNTTLPLTRNYCQNPKSCFDSDLKSETREDDVLKDLAMSASPLAKSVFSPQHNNGISDGQRSSRNGLTDLHMFLREVGTNPKEGRYWLKHFQSAMEPHRLFAVVQVDQEVIHNQQTLHSLCACLSFLHRHQMQVVVVHGPTVPSSDNREDHSACRKQLVSDSMILIDSLERSDAVCRPLLHGASIFHLQDADLCCGGPKPRISMDAVQWALRSNSIVIVPSLGELGDGRLVPFDITAATGAIAKELKPLKVLIINNNGGFTNEKGQVIANVNIPNDLDSIFQSSWCTPTIKKKVNDIVSLLHSLPSQSSVVISSATRLLAELFTHRGSGTFFKMMESIQKFKSLKDIDVKKLTQLIESGFGRTLSQQYPENLEGKLNTLYLVEGYTAAAVITNESGISVPYLDKFVVCSSRSGESLGQMLWDAIRADFPQLFWRSRNSNIINSWYFMHCDGCRRHEYWTVFWYGAVSESVSHELVEYALNLPNSFTDASSVMKHVCV